MNKFHLILASHTMLSIKLMSMPEREFVSFPLNVFFCANFDGWLNEKQLVKTINYPQKQVSRPQKANGSRRILPQSVNYCWICQFSWRERESSSITLHHELVSYCNVCLWFSANLFSDFFSLCSNPNQAAIQWSTLKKLHNEFTSRENWKLSLQEHA